MKKLVLFFVLLTGKGLAQNTVLQPLYDRTVAGHIKDTRGLDINECILILKFKDKDSLFAAPNGSGYFTFKNVKSASFTIDIISQPGSYAKVVYPYDGDPGVKHIELPEFTLGIMFKEHSILSKRKWKAGDNLDAAPDIFRPAQVLAVNADSTYFKVHYEDGSHPDSWIDGRYTRNYNLQFKADSAVWLESLRPGKYGLSVIDGDIGHILGYCVINGDGTYEVFLRQGSKLDYTNPQLTADGKGEYTFNKTSGIIKWLTGPFSKMDAVSKVHTSIDNPQVYYFPLTKDGLSAGYGESK